MEFAKSFQDLDKDEIKLMAENLTDLEDIFTNKAKLYQFLESFPFDKLLKINVTEVKSTEHIIKIINFLAQYTEFYQSEYAIFYSIEFLIINLNSIKFNWSNLTFCLEIIQKILKIVSDMGKVPKNIFKDDRLFAILIDILTTKGLERQYYQTIANSILFITRLTDANNIKIIRFFNIFKELGGIREMCLLSQYVLESHENINITEDYQDILIWLCQECPKFLIKVKCDEQTSSEIITTLSLLIDTLKYLQLDEEQCLKQLNNNLLNVVSEICIYASNQTNKVLIWQLLDYILKIFTFAQVAKEIREYNYLQDLGNLAETCEEWPKADAVWFFTLAHMTMLHSRLLWKSDHIMQSISRSFYTKKFDFSLITYKSIYFLYSNFITTSPKSTLISVLGDDLLRTFNLQHLFSNLYSLEKSQLGWILKDDYKELKIQIVRLWLTKGINIEILKCSIKEYHSEEIIVDILYNDYDQDSGLKALELVKKMNDPIIGNKISFLLPSAIRKGRKLFYHLLLSEPGVPSNPELSLKLLIMMGLITASIKDLNILKSACQFSRKLLIAHKDNPESVPNFCKNMANIKSLFSLIQKIDDDETGIELIKLLRNLAQIQKKTKVKFDSFIREDFQILLANTCSKNKILAIIELLIVTIADEHCFLKIDETNLHNLYHNLLDLSCDTEYTQLTYCCLKFLIKKKPELITNLPSIVHITMRCSGPPDFPNIGCFLKFLHSWLKYYIACKGWKYCPISSETIRSFLHRVPCGVASHVPPSDILQCLDKIPIMPRTIFG